MSTLYICHACKARWVVLEEGRLPFSSGCCPHCLSDNLLIYKQHPLRIIPPRRALKAVIAIMAFGALIVFLFLIA